MKLHSMPTLPAILALSLEVAGRPMFATGADLGARAAETVCHNEQSYPFPE